MTWTTRIVGETALAMALILAPSVTFATDTLSLSFPAVAEDSDAILGEAQPVSAQSHLTHDSLGEGHGFGSPEPLASGDFTEKPAEAANSFMYIPEPSTLSIALLLAVGSIPVALRRKWG